MRHAKVGRKFGRKKGERNAFLKGLASNLIKHGRIETTEARAKSVRPLVERLVTVAKRQNVAALRRLLAKVDQPAAEKLYYDIAARYKDRRGGYLRISKLELTRQRDRARKAAIEFV